MQRQEIPNNTPEQLRDYVLQTLELLDDLVIPLDLREAAFTGILNLISGKQIVMVQPQPIDLAALTAPRGRH